MKYKALICDVDGTLVANTKNSLPSQRVIDTINEASKYIHIGVATARPLIMVKPIFEQLNLSGPSIINGGAQIVDAKSHIMFREQALIAEDLASVQQILERKLKVDYFINDDGNDHIPGARIYIPNKPFHIATRELTPERADEVVESLSHIPTIAVHKFLWQEVGTIGVLITHASATKQHGILEVARLLNINTHEIIGVGDGPNDFPLFMASGLRVAMGNAIPDLKAIADYITASVEEDGVAELIDKFILKK